MPKLGFYFRHDHLEIIREHSMNGPHHAYYKAAQ